MEALQSYASDSDSSESYTTQTKKKSRLSEAEVDSPRLEGPRSPTGDASSLPPPPPDLLNASNSSCVQMTDAHCRRVRNFPHVEGNFALHVYIPVPLSSIAKRKLEPLMKKAFSISPELEPMDIDSPSHSTHPCMSHGLKLAKEYHISLSRTVPIRIHQIDSIVAMLRHNFESQKGYWLELDQWEVFVNDDQTRSFLSLEVLDRGSFEICRQIHSVNKIFKLHNLPTYYEILYGILSKRSNLIDKNHWYYHWIFTRVTSDEFCYQESSQGLTPPHQSKKKSKQANKKTKKQVHPSAREVQDRDYSTICPELLMSRNTLRVCVKLEKDYNLP